MISLISLLDEVERKVGSTWKTSNGKFGAKDIYGRVRYYDTDEQAKKFANTPRLTGKGMMSPGDRLHKQVLDGE